MGDYLKELFEGNQIFLNQDNFLEEMEEPYLAFAKMLNLIPSSYQINREITQRERGQISKKFLLIKDKILLDGLYGKIDMHEHCRTGGDVEEFLRAAGSLGISKVLFVPTGFGPDNRGYKTHQNFLIEYIKKLYPDKIISFCTIDEADVEAAEVFEQCLRDGDYVVEEREVEFGTPGVSVESTYNDGCYTYMSGTSMATPHTSGLAAKVWDIADGIEDGTGNAADTRSYLQSIAKDIWDTGYDTATGFGLPIAP